MYRCIIFLQNFLYVCIRGSAYKRHSPWDNLCVKGALAAKFMFTDLTQILIFYS